MFCDKFYEQMIQEGGSRKNQPKASEKKEPDVNKIFPEFNIKTKYMKKQVKDNILKVVYDVKAQLLKEYHLSNVTTSSLRWPKCRSATTMVWSNCKRNANQSPRRE